MPHPSVFYKYTSAETTKLILEGGRIRWSSPLIFNDLSEFQRMPRFQPAIADTLPKLAQILLQKIANDEPLELERLAPQTKVLVALLRMLRGTLPDLSALPKELLEEVAGADAAVEAGLREFVGELDLKTVRVLCVTTDFDNDAMWANYASGHAGCVLGLRHVPSYDTPLLAAVQVNYSEDQPVVGSGLDFLLYGPTRELLRSTVHAICFTKKVHWSYEKEWRAMTRRAEGEKMYSDFKFFPEELESITLGPRVNEDLAQSIVQLVDTTYPNCDLYRLQVENGTTSRHIVQAARGA